MTTEQTYTRADLHSQYLLDLAEVCGQRGEGTRRFLRRQCAQCDTITIAPASAARQRSRYCLCSQCLPSSGKAREIRLELEASAKSDSYQTDEWVRQSLARVSPRMAAAFARQQGGER